MLLADVVETSRRVSETSKRLEKVDLLAALLRRVHPDEIEIVVSFLAGQIRQGRIGIGYSTLQESAGSPAAIPSLEIPEVDRVFQSIIAATGSGSQRQRFELLHALLTRATEAEQQFLFPVISGRIAPGRS